MEQVSVILPTYNRLSLLKRAVESVSRQSYPHWELIVVNDGSTDQTRQWLESQALFQTDQAQAIHISNQGVSRARNVGIEAACGNWIALLDSDDEWLPEKLQRQVEYSLQHPHRPVIHGEEIWIRNGVRVNPCKHHRKYGGRIFEQCVPLCSLSPSTVMIRKDLFITEGMFKEDFPVCEDYDLWLRLCSRFEVGLIKTPIVIKYGGHRDQLSRRYKIMDYWRVKALAPFLTSPRISEKERDTVRETMKTKCKILLHGYKKHKNRSNFNEVLSLLHQAEES